MPAACSASAISILPSSLPAGAGAATVSNDPATPMTPALAWNTRATSFVDQYQLAGLLPVESTRPPRADGRLACPEPSPAATGIAVAVALMRGFVRRQCQRRSATSGSTSSACTRWHPAADRGRLRALCWCQASSRISICTPASPSTLGGLRRSPDRVQPGRPSGTGHQRRRLLQRQLRAPSENPTPSPIWSRCSGSSGHQFPAPRTFMGFMVAPEPPPMGAVMAALHHRPSAWAQAVPARQPRHGPDGAVGGPRAMRRQHSGWPIPRCSPT